MRILLFGDGQWAAHSLSALVARGHEIAGVCLRTHPSDPYLGDTATRLGALTFAAANVNSVEVASEVAALAPDLSLSISYNQIIHQPLLSVAPLGFVNFHAGRLPRYRGRNVINWAIINGETEIGLTAHYVDEGIDSGDIILQQTFPIGWCDTYGDVLARIVAAVPDLVIQTVDLIASGSAPRVPQDDANATYYCGREEGDEWLDWTDTSRALYNKTRAITHPGPGARTLLNGKVVRIWSAEYDPSWPKYIATPGQVIGHKDAGSLVKTGDSVLLVTTAQNGQGSPEAPRWRIGTRLGLNLPVLALALAAEDAGAN